jgi:molecular chaperone HtpG
LNVSREAVQSNAVIARLKKILTGQLLNALKDQADKQPESYQRFWEEFGRFIKEGIATDQTEREKLYPLLRFRTTKHPDQWRSLNEYVGA